jgi:hypothetical protein
MWPVMSKYQYEQWRNENEMKMANQCNGEMA